MPSLTAFDLRGVAWTARGRRGAKRRRLENFMVGVLEGIRQRLNKTNRGERRPAPRTSGNEKPQRKQVKIGQARGNDQLDRIKRRNS